MVRVKICGIMRSEDVALCSRMGVDLAGFVTEYPAEVPWNLTREEAEPLIRQVQLPMRSCVVTGGERNKISDLAERLRPDFIQLHYRETLEDVKWIVRQLEPYGIGVIKTIPFSKEERNIQFGTDSVAQCISLLDQSGVRAILADSRSVNNASGPGRMADLKIYRMAAELSNLPVILAGGIAPENAEKLIKTEKPDWVDVMTGVEVFPGVKDPMKLRAIMDAAKKP